MPIADIFNAKDTEVQARMITYIRQHFGELLGPHLALLDQPDGLEMLSDMLRQGRIGPPL